MTPFRFIGDADTALGFRFAGVPGDAVSDPQAALEAFQTALADRNLVVLVITEKVSEWLTDQVAAHKLSAQKPFIATVGDVWGTPGKSKTLDQLIFEAVGVKLVDTR